MKDGGQAFPAADSIDLFPGMTMRQWYKGMSMMGYNANPVFSTSHPDKIIELSVKDADAQIAEDEQFEKREAENGSN